MGRGLRIGFCITKNCHHGTRSLGDDAEDNRQWVVRREDAVAPNAEEDHARLLLADVVNDRIGYLAAVSYAADWFLNLNRAGGYEMSQRGG